MRLKVKKQVLIWLALAALLAVCPVFGAVQDEYILRCSPTAISGVLSRHGMTLVRSASEYSVYLVRSPAGAPPAQYLSRSEEHTSELQSQSNLVCRLLLEKKKTISDNRFQIDNPQT